MRIVRAADFTGVRAWDADLIATIGGATVRLHWTDEPYVWHVNDGDEVFAVLDGGFDMHVRDADGEHGWRSVTCSTPTSGWNTSPTRVDRAACS